MSRADTSGPTQTKDSPLENEPCLVCGSKLSLKFQKLSERNQKKYQIFSCSECGLWQLSPRPSPEDQKEVHDEGYFTTRTSRGYDNYQSEAIKKSVVSTLEKNLTDLDFYNYEDSLDTPRRAIEIGSAAGYFVEYLKERQWEITGVDISTEMCRVAKSRGLPVVCDDFLELDLPANSYDLIAMWATLEHWSDPRECLVKVNRLLKPGGKFYISTTNTGFWARIYGIDWRYLNVPEHVFYFNRRSLMLLGERFGLELTRSFTYGSGFTTKAGMNLFQKAAKRIADKLAKYDHSGDMIVAEFTKRREIT